MTALKLHAPTLVALRHEDIRTVGIPDMSITGFGRTCWWEFKAATPRVVSTGIQELTMLRLAAAGFARYIVWQEHRDGSNKRTLIVHPTNLKDLLPEAFCIGYDMRFLVDYILKVHRT